MKILLIYGGNSAEHDVSVLSAHSILRTIYYDYYSVLPIYITREGKWLRGQLVEKEDKVPSREEMAQAEGKTPFTFTEMQEDDCIAFPVLHGPNGEDGTIQGVFETLNIPYVGSGVLSSAIGMDKIISKRLFKEAGLPVVPYKEITLNDWSVDADEILEEVEEALIYPYYVKPVNMGSSIGVTRVKERDELVEAINLAFKYDHRIIVEEGYEAREIEIGVLGNEEVYTSVPGEILKSKSFYGYEDKYFSEKTKRSVPSELSEDLTKKLRTMAVKAFRAINGNGVSRVDFFLTEDNSIFINEVNTFPGFTDKSMYPRVWAETGLPYQDLIEEVIQLGIRRHKYKQEHHKNTQ